ncbi:acyltransferase [Streptomyces sp. WAC 05977]|nr:acyltransferase [Streptomyces sp. WAC 05977]
MAPRAQSRRRHQTGDSDRINRVITGPISRGAIIMSSGKAGRVGTLEGLRGVLALGILLYHVAFMTGVASFIDQPGHPFWGVLIDGLMILLPPFFVMSGMFLFRAHARNTVLGTKKPSTKSFLWGRALRILPGYWVLVIVGLLTINLTAIDSAGDILRPLTMLHFFWWEGQPVIGLEHTWTVPAEFTFYLLMPILGWMAHRFARNGATPAQRARRMLIPLAGFSLIGFGWILLTNFPGFTAPSQLWFWPIYFFPVFAVGMALAVLAAYAEVAPRKPAIYRMVLKRPNLFWVVALVLFAVYTWKPIGIPGMGDVPAMLQEFLGFFLGLAFAVLLVLPLSVPGATSKFQERVLANRPIRFAGKISFGIYLWHVVIVEYWFANGSIFGVEAVHDIVFRGTTGFWPMLAFVLGFTVIAATLSYYLIERPAQRLRHRRTKAPVTQLSVTGDQQPQTDTRAA